MSRPWTFPSNLIATGDIYLDASDDVTNGNTFGGPCPAMSYNSNNQLTAVGGTGVTYDAAGDLTNDGSHTYQYDAEGRLSSVDSGSTWKFVYNALGERAEWISSGGADQHLFDPWGTWLGNAGEYSTLPALGLYRALYINGETAFLH